MVLGSNGEAASVFGQHDENLRFLVARCPAKIVARGNEVAISGERDEVEAVARTLHQLQEVARTGAPVTVSMVNYAWQQARENGKDQELAMAWKEVLYVTPRGKQIRPRTIGQYQYVEAIRGHDIVFGIGPAGTGKTYLAVLMAVLALRSKRVERIVLARPAVEAGEKLGFLPGDLLEKVNPYLRPLYDSLYDIIGVEAAQKYLERSVIEVAPLAYMRGRTLDQAFIILDEAQNTTPEQMKMFLTRTGLGSQAVITGDITQIDLPKGSVSGLIQSIELLSGIEGMAFHFFSEADVVRHPLVQKIIQAYDRMA